MRRPAAAPSWLEPPRTAGGARHRSGERMLLRECPEDGSGDGRADGALRGAPPVPACDHPGASPASGVGFRPVLAETVEESAICQGARIALDRAYVYRNALR